MTDLQENKDYQKALKYLKSYPYLSLSYFQKAGVSKECVLEALGNVRSFILDVTEKIIHTNLFAKYHGLVEKIIDIEDEISGASNGK